MLGPVFRGQVIASNGSPYLTMQDEEGRERIGMAITEKSEVGVSITDKDGFALFHILIGDDGKLHLDFYDNESETTLTFHDGVFIPKKDSPSDPENPSIQN